MEELPNYLYHDMSTDSLIVTRTSQKINGLKIMDPKQKFRPIVNKSCQSGSRLVKDRVKNWTRWKLV